MYSDEGKCSMMNFAGFIKSAKSGKSAKLCPSKIHYSNNSLSDSGVKTFSSKDSITFAYG